MSQNWAGNWEDEDRVFRTLEPIELHEFTDPLPIGTTGVIDWLDGRSVLSDCYAHVTFHFNPKINAVVELKKLYPANGLDVVFDAITEHPKTS